MSQMSSQGKDGFSLFQVIKISYFLKLFLLAISAQILGKVVVVAGLVVVETHAFKVEYLSSRRFFLPTV